MAEQKYSFESDLKEAEAMAAALTPYVYGEDLYGRMGGNSPMLTLGALLLRIRRLNALQDKMTTAQRMRLQKVVDQHDSVAREWHTHYEAKLLREANSRLDDLQTYLKECNEDLRACAGAYMPEALRRTMVQEIADTLADMNGTNVELLNKMKRIDTLLRRFLEPSDFVWDKNLQLVYPPDMYWWLYNRPPK
jgi:hypothetical protein